MRQFLKSAKDKTKNHKKYYLVVYCKITKKELEREREREREKERERERELY